MTNPVMTDTQRWYTRKQASELTGKSTDTLKRLEKKGLLRGRVQPDCSKGTIEYSYSALVDAGLCDPAGPGVLLPATLDATSPAVELTVELAEAQAQLEAQRQLLEAAQAETQRLWGLIAQLTGGER